MFERVDHFLRFALLPFVTFFVLRQAPVGSVVPGREPLVDEERGAARAATKNLEGALRNAPVRARPDVAVPASRGALPSSPAAAPVDPSEGPSPAPRAPLGESPR